MKEGSYKGFRSYKKGVLSGLNFEVVCGGFVGLLGVWGLCPILGILANVALNMKASMFWYMLYLRSLWFGVKHAGLGLLRQHAHSYCYVS